MCYIVSNIGARVMNRLKEPSSYAGLALIFNGISDCMTVYSIVAMTSQSCTCIPANVIPVTIIGGDVLIAAMLNPCSKCWDVSAMLFCTVFFLQNSNKP